MNFLSKIQASSEALECKVDNLKGDLRKVAYDFKQENDVWPEGLVFKPTNISCFVGQSIKEDEILLYLED